MQLLKLLTFSLLCFVSSVNISLAASDDVRIIRDNYGVPHVYADDVYSLFYGYGYAVAQDRLFQMEMARRSTQGLVAEVLGEEFADYDESARRLFLPASIHAQLAELNSEDLDVFRGYAAGFNAWIDELGKEKDILLPREFIDFDFSPVKWTAYDVAMIFVGTMANRFGDFNTELENLQILSQLTSLHGEKIAVRIFDDLNPRFTEAAPTTIDADEWPASNSKSSAISPATYKSFNPDKEAVVETAQIPGFSNCFVLGPDKVSGANAILVNGPQFGWFVPSYVYSIGLHGAGFDIVGNTPFAYPVILFAHNGDIAWGSTWGAGDIVDIFRENINPDNADEYLYKGSYRKFQKRSETIAVRNGVDRTIQVQRSVHGQITSTDETNGIAYARKRAWDGNEIETLLAWMHAGRASSYAEWLEYVEKPALNINWYYADRAGNIGYAFIGHYPQRADGHDNRLTANGDGSMDWQGRQPFSTNPRVLNPRKAYIANWNNKPGEGVLNPDEFWYSWFRADRVDYLHVAIESQDEFTAEQAWQLIESSSHADVIAPYFLELIAEAAAKKGNEQLSQVSTLLQKWDRQSRDQDRDGYYDGPETLIFQTFLATLLEQVLADDLGAAFDKFATTGYPAPGKPTGSGVNIGTGVKTLVEALHGKTAYDFLNGGDAVDVVAHAMSSSFAELQKEHGMELSAWRMPVAPRPYRTRNFLGIPQTTEDNSMQAAIEQNRGTENNMMVMSDDGVIAYEVISPGQSGFISSTGEKSRHYDDQFELYDSFARKRMWFTDAEVQANKRSELVLQLKPGG